MENKKLIKNLNLAENEEVRLIIRRYLLIYWWQILLVLIFLLLPFFLLYPLFQWARWGPAVFAILLALGLLGLLRLYIVWYFNCLVVTSQRMVDFDQKGPLDRTVSEVALDKVDDISYRRKGLVQSLLNYGLVQYSIPPGRAKIIVKGVKNPQEVCQKIIGLVAAARREKGKVYDQPINTAAGLKELLKEMKQELGTDGFKKVLQDVEVEPPKPARKQEEEIKDFLERKD